MKTATVQDWATPCTLKDVRAFLGLVSYYRHYIPNFAAVAAPLMALTKRMPNSYGAVMVSKPSWPQESSGAAACAFISYEGRGICPVYGCQ